MAGLAFLIVVASASVMGAVIYSFIEYRKEHRKIAEVYRRLADRGY